MNGDILPTDHTGLQVLVTDQQLEDFGDAAADAPVVISGPLAGVVRWATGRGTDGVTASQNGATLGTVPAAPKWI